MYQQQPSSQAAYQQQNMGMGNRQPIKQFKPSPRVGMAAGGNVAAGGSGVPVRPGTAGGNNAGGQISAQGQY